MADCIRAETNATISELMKNPLDTVAAGDGSPVAILDGDKPVFYCVPAQAYEAMLERMEDVELNAVADARNGQAVHRLSLDAL